MAEDSSSASTSFEAKVVDPEAKIQCVVCFDEISQHQAISCPINNPSCNGHTCYTCTIRSIDSDDRLTRRCFSCQCEVTLDDLSKKLGFTKLTLRDNTIRVTKIIMREYQPGRVQIIPIEQPAGDQRIPILGAAEAAAAWPRLQPQPNAVPHQQLADEIIQQQNMAVQAQRAAIVPPQEDEQAQNPLIGQVQALWLPDQPAQGPGLWLPAHPNHLALPGEQAPLPQQVEQAQPPQDVRIPPQQAEQVQPLRDERIPQQVERAQLIRIGQFRALLLPGRPGQGPALLIPGNLALPGEQVPPPQQAEQAQLPQDVRFPPQQAEQAQLPQDARFPPQQAEQAQPLRDERAQSAQPQPIRKRAQPHQPEQDHVGFRQPPPVQRPVYPTCSKCEKNNHAIIPCMNIFCDQIVCCVCFREILPQAAQTGPGSPMTCTKCLRSYSCQEWAQHADRRIPTFERLIYP